MISLDGQIALVTGGSRGIGRATALALAAAGADVVLSYLNSPRDAQDVGEEILALGRETLVVKADLSEAEDVTNLIGAVESHFGGLDILVSNAAGGGFRPLLEVNADNFAYAMNLNVRSFMLLMQSAAHLLSRTGGDARKAPATDRGPRPERARAITVSSWGAARALPMYGAIGATKAALESMTRHFALELGPRGVNVNCVRAGVVDTGAIRALPGAEALLTARRQRSLAGDRDLTAADVANAVLFLASPLADMVQGATLIVDGGTSLHA